MKDFLDVLLEQMHQPRASRDEARYLNRLRSLAASAPPRRPILQPHSGLVAHALTLHEAPQAQLFLNRPDVDLFFYAIAEAAAEPRWFRLAKSQDEYRAIGRLDALGTEAQVLETIAMGADLYSLDVCDHDDVSLQYLAEVGEDYAVPVLLRCYKEEDIARALEVQADTWIGLGGAIAVAELLDLDIFKDRSVILQHAWDGTEVPGRHALKQLILHWDRIEEPWND